MTPSPILFGRSAYTVLGGVGYVAAVTVAMILAIIWQLTLGERLVAVLAPPLAFIAVTTIATALKGREWIVFYQTAAGAIATTMIAGLVIGANLPRLADVVVIGIGTFLVFGRIGCFHVACCHGRPARSGVRYDERHVGLGLWSACADRPLWPVQLFEAGGTAVLVGGALVAAAETGRAACVFAVGYATIRFFLELLRGDPVRPIFLGISEAQWWCVATAAACAVARATWWTIAAAMLLAVAALALTATRRRRELAEPHHVRELDNVCAAVLTDPAHARCQTALGVAASCHALPDGRLDWVWSSSHPAWSIAVATRLSDFLWPDAELVSGRTPEIIHVVVRSSDRRASRSDLVRHGPVLSRGSSSTG